MNHSNQTCQLLSAKALGEMLSRSRRQVFRQNSAGRIPKTLSTSGSDRFLVSDVSIFLQCGCDIAGFQAQKQSQFKDVQETLGTLLLALNWDGWADEERAALLHCIDCLERKLIDIKHGVCREKGR